MFSFTNLFPHNLFLGACFLIVNGISSPNGILPKIENNRHPLLTSFDIDPQDTFPVPSGNSKQLFYLQRTSNTNTIVCELNLDNNGQLNEENPVHVFWMRYAEGGKRKELNYIQRVFAYGINAKSSGNGMYQLHFVSYKKQNLTLMRSTKDNKYHVYANINKKQALLNRIFLKVDGGTFWSPNIVYMEVKGTDPITGKEMMERFKPL